MSDDWQYKTAMEALNAAHRQVGIIVIVAASIILSLLGVIIYLIC